MHIFCWKLLRYNFFILSAELIIHFLPNGPVVSRAAVGLELRLKTLESGL